MTKAQVVETIHRKTDIDRITIKIVINAFLHVIMQQVARNVTITLRGFGNFFPKPQAAKTARNMALNTRITIPATTVPGFKPSDEFKRAVKAANLTL